MKATKTPTMKLEVKHDNDLLRSNGIYMAGTDNRIVYVDDLFDQMPVMVKRYLLLHEEGHIMAEHPHKRTLSQELEADRYAMKKMGKSITFICAGATDCHGVTPRRGSSPHVDGY